MRLIPSRRPGPPKDADRRNILLAAMAAPVWAGLPGGAVMAQPAVGLQRIAFGSCINQALPQPIWAAVLAARPELFIFGGDNVYASEQPWSRDKLQAAYAQLAANTGFARLRQAVPHLAIWDDNDYGLNDGGADFVHRQASKDAFMDFWQLPADDERRSRGGLHHARSFGPLGQRVQVILLDVRWSRSPWRATDQRNAPGRERYLPDADPAKTLLGAAQWQWLDAQLREPADLRLIVSGIQVVADGHGWECWANLPSERQRLYDLIGSTGARGAVFLSGDRHIGAFYREAGSAARPVPYPLVDCTASGMTHAWKGAAEAGPNRIGPLYDEPHFGMLDIDWAERRVVMTLRDLAGRPQRALTLALADLGPDL